MDQCNIDNKQGAGMPAKAGRTCGKKILPWIIILPAFSGLLYMLYSIADNPDQPDFSNDDVINKLIAVVIVLFITSITTERFTEFLKMNLPECGEALGIQWGPYKSRQRDEDAEVKRTRNIQRVSWVTGLFITLILNADLIQLIQHADPTEVMGMQHFGAGYENYGGATVRTLLGITGCAATALFCSVGSKFWHDLLDLLLQVKNAKRIAADPETYKVDNIASFDKIFSTYESSFIQAAFMEARSKFMASHNVRSFSLKSDAIGHYFEVCIVREDPEMAGSYRYLIDSAATQSIRIKSLIVGEEKSKALGINLAEKIFNHSAPGNKGSLGCLVKDEAEQKYILTCAHNVISKAELRNLPVLPDGRIVDTVAIPGIGVLHQAIWDSETDAALIKVEVDKFAKISNVVPGMGKVAGSEPRVLRNNDKNKTKLHLYGAQSENSAEMINKNGVMTGVYCDVKIWYTNDIEFKLINLISFSNNGKGPGVAGDSGSCILDENNHVVGLLIGGNTRESYILSIDVLLEKFKVKLI